MSPYIITSAILTTYSGKKVHVLLESKVFTEPLRKVKDAILNAFIKACKTTTDPFVAIECKTKPLFK